jgi:hypothetical protein
MTRCLPLLLLTACGGLYALPPDDTDATSDSDAPDSDAPDSDAPDSDAPDDPVDPPIDSTIFDDSDPPDDTTPPVDTDPPAPPAPWSAAITVDGAWDCPAGAGFLTTTPPTAGLPAACLTWDPTYVYVAWRHPDASTGTAAHFFWLYTGHGGPGALTGVTYNTQQPGLVAPMTRHLRRKADGSFDSLLTWSGVAWTDSAPGWLSGGGRQVARAGDVLELRLPRADLGVTDTLLIAGGWLFEGAGSETTFSGSPSTAFSDGYDPDLTHVWQFDLTSPDAPNTATPWP